MTKKDMNKKDVKICGICQKQIIIPGEQHCMLVQYDRDGRWFSEGFYHVKCYGEKFVAHNKANEMIGRTMNLLTKAEERFA